MDKEGLKNMKKIYVIFLIITAFLCTSCTIAVQKHRILAEKDFEVTVDNGCEKTVLFSMDREDTAFGKSFRLSMTFVKMDVYEDHWLGESFIDIDLFR